MSEWLVLGRFPQTPRGGRRRVMGSGDRGILGTEGRGCPISEAVVRTAADGERESHGDE